MSLTKAWQKWSDTLSVSFLNNLSKIGVARVAFEAGYQAAQLHMHGDSANASACPMCKEELICSMCGETIAYPPSA